MSLHVCVIDDETGLLYEWNGARTVNIYSLLDWDGDYDAWMGPNVTDKFGLDVWTLGADEVDALEFIASVHAHVEGYGME